jgi:hypothetical protein
LEGVGLRAIGELLGHELDWVIARSSCFTEAGCANVGRLFAARRRRRPISNPELCHAHVPMRIARDRAAALEVYDDRIVRANDW